MTQRYRLQQCCWGAGGWPCLEGNCVWLEATELKKGVRREARAGQGRSVSVAAKEHTSLPQAR